MKRIVLAIIAVAALCLTANTALAANYSTTPIGPWHPADGVVSDIQRIDNVIYIAGNFTALIGPNGQRVQIARLAAVDAYTGDLITSFNPNPNGWVRALETDNGVLIVGGDFTTIGGASRSRLAILTTSGAVTAWTANATGSVRALDVANGLVYVGGAFTNIDGVQRNRLAAINTTTSVATSWNPGANNTVTSVAVYSDIGVIVGGRFTVVANTSMQYLGAVTFGGGASPYRPTVSPCSSSTNPCYVFGIATDAANVYVAIGGPGGRVNAFNHAGTRIWTRTGDGDNQTIAAYDGKVYVGGHFGPAFGGQTRNGLVVLNASNGAVDSYAVSFTGSLRVWALFVDATGLYVGGEFTKVNNNAAYARYVKFQIV